jgi:transposase
MLERRSTDVSAVRSWTRTGAASCSNRIRASIQDRDGGGPLLCVSRRIFPFIQRVFADSGYAGEKIAKATLIAVEIVRKNPDQIGFAVNPRRWVVERFFAWIGRNRRLAKDFEATIDSARAFLYAASIMLLVRRIARAS